MRLSSVTTADYGNRKRLMISLSLKGLKGSLRCVGKTGGLILGIDNSPAFSISSVKVSGNSLAIYTTAGYNAISGIDCCQLAYQPSDNEYICDTSGNRLEPLPPFPLFRQGCYSPYCHCGEITGIYPLDVPWNHISVRDIPGEDSYKPFVCNHNVISPRVLNGHREYPDNSIVFIRFRFMCHQDTDLELLWGCSGKLKISIDGSEMESHRSRRLTFASFVQKATWNKGMHTIDAAFSNTLKDRGDKGITLKVRVDDSLAELPELIRDDKASYFFNV